MSVRNQGLVSLVVSTQGNAGGNLFSNAWRQYGEPVWNQHVQPILDQYGGVAAGAAIGGVEGYVGSQIRRRIVYWLWTKTFNVISERHP